MKPRFRVIAFGQWPDQDKDVFTLVRDRWDDFTFKTTFEMQYRDRAGEVHQLGTVKIAQFGMGAEHASTKLPDKFSGLASDFFSLGQDREYYERLRGLPDGLSSKVLAALRDMALDLELFDRALQETVTVKSLIRNVDPTVVRAQFHWIARGEAPRTDFRFTYTGPTSGRGLPASLSFEVTVDSIPPTNVHVIIGANGVGKSTLMRNFAESLRSDADPLKSGSFVSLEAFANRNRRVPFDNVVTVTFSAFDTFPGYLNDPDGSTGDLPHHVVGLEGAPSAGLDDRLAIQFSASLRACVRSPRRERWLDALAILTEADPVLAALNVEDLITRDLLPDGVEGASEFFDELSSGHKIVLLTITSLIRYVEERTLLLLDEPETHLHPPLLSALVRAVTQLSIDRNGVAILATHSPVVLQEVPRRCVTVLSRSGEIVSTSPPRIETFAETISVLTSEVFGLDVRETGFHDILSRAARAPVDGVTKYELGAEGRAVLRALNDQIEKDDEF
ncbi:putative ATPase [Agrococcus sp. UYP33]